MHSKKISSDTIIDIQATKKVFDKVSLIPPEDFDSEHIVGFIQQILAVPFGFLMISHIQIVIWAAIILRNPVWFFDPTGSVIKDIDGQKSPFLYSIVAHDPKTQTIVPAAEFITTSHTVTSICQNLILIKDTLEKYINKTSYVVAPIIVVNFSWALINSVLRV